MILLSTWFGLRFLNSLNPIMSIILDSQKIINDNFRSRNNKGKMNSISYQNYNQILNSLAIQKIN